MASQSNDNQKTTLEGTVDLIDDFTFSYAVLESGEVVISQNSFYDYLGINTKDKNISFFPSPTDNVIPYQPKSGNDVELGISVMEVSAFCITVIELNAETKSYQEIARKAVILLMFLATAGLDQLILESQAEAHKNESENFDSMLSGLMKVPPPKQ